MKRLFLLIMAIGLAGAVSGQTFTFECYGGYLTGADCQICTGQTTARLFNGLIIRRDGNVYKLIDCPYIIKVQGQNLVFQELVYPNPETVTINRAGTSYSTITGFRDSTACMCAQQDSSWIGGGGGGDDWGTQVVQRDSSLSGNGTTANPLGIKGYGAASNGQVPSKATGGITWITPLTAEVDGSVTNEGILGVAAGAANTSVITSNTSGAVGVTVSGSNTILVTETTSSNGGTILLQGDTSLLATVNDVNAARNRDDSTFARLPGELYHTKRITSNAYRYGTTGFRTTDTSGVVNIRAINSDGKTPLSFRYEGATSGVAGSAMWKANLKAYNSALWNLGAAFQISDDNGSGGADSRPNTILKIGHNVSGINNVETGNNAMFDSWESYYYVDSDDDGIKEAGAERHLILLDSTGYQHRPYSFFLPYNQNKGATVDYGVSKLRVFGSKYAQNSRVNINTAAILNTPFIVANDTLGTYSPTDPLFTASAIFCSKNRTSITGDEATSIYLRGSETSGSLVGIRGQHTSTNKSSGFDMVLSTQGNNSNGNQTDRITIKAGATTLVGINEISPAQTLDVEGTMRVTGSDGTATTIAGRDGDGDVSAITVGGGLTLSANTLSVTASGADITRALPTVVNSVVYIGTVAKTNGVATIYMDVNAQGGGGVSVAKTYQLASFFNATGGVWQVAPCIASTGVYSGQDFQVEIRSNSSTDSLRIRRTVGTVAATVYISIRVTPASITTFTEYSGTASGVPAITTIFSLNGFHNEAGNVGVKTIAPAQTLHVQGTARITGSDGTATTVTGRDADGDVSNVTVGSGLLLSGGTLSATAANTNFTRTVPTVVGNTVQLGFFTKTNGAADYDIKVVIPSSGVSIAKTYIVSSFYSSTGGVWQILPPITSTGAFSGHDFVLEIKSNNSLDSLRLRRTAGTSAATAYIDISYSASAVTTFTALSGTDNPTAITATFSLSALAQAANKIGINNIAPARSLHVTGEVRITDLVTDTPTGIVGADADGDLGLVSLAAGLSIPGGVLTPADASATNEIETFASTSDATSHTVTLAPGSTSFQLIEGSNITLTTGGTGANATVTIAATSGGSFYQTIKDENVALAQQPIMNFLASSDIDWIITDDGANTETEITADIKVNAVQYAEIQTVSASKLLGNPTGSTANVSEIGLGAGLAFSGTDLVVSGAITTANNGLYISGGTTVRLGSNPLIEATLIDQDGNDMRFYDGKLSYSFNNSSFTPTQGMGIRGLEASPTTNSTPTQDGVIELGVYNSGGSFQSNSLTFGGYATDADGFWMQARSNSVPNAPYPLSAQPRGGQFSVGRLTGLDALVTFSATALSGSTASGSVLHLENVEGNQKAAMTFGVSAATDVVDGEIAYFDATDAVRVTNRNTTTGTSSLRFAVGGETSDRVIIVAATVTPSARMGIGTTAPTSTLHSAGSFASAFITTTTATTLDERHCSIAYTGTASVTFTLPAASSCSGREYMVVHHGSSGTITFSTTITKGNASTFNTLTAGQWTFFKSDGTIWRGFKQVSL